jgi:undecaprenyl pyrophosphate phosphatase UppP
MPKFAKFLWGVVSNAPTVWGLLPASFTAPIWTFVAGAVVTAFAFYQGIQQALPVPYLIAACVITFGGVFWMANNASDWRERNRVAGKFRLVSVTAHGESEADPEGILVKKV